MAATKADRRSTSKQVLEDNPPTHSLYIGEICVSVQ